MNDIADPFRELCIKDDIKYLTQAKILKIRYFNDRQESRSN